MQTATGELDPELADFDAFFRDEFPKMVALALAMTGVREVARDLAQDSMTSAFRRWDEVSGLERPGAWLRRATINAAISWRRRSLTERAAIARLRPTTVDAPREPEERFWECVRSLPPRQRSVTGLYYVEDRSVADIAEILDIAEGTVKATLSKARSSLATTLSLSIDEGAGS